MKCQGKAVSCQRRQWKGSEKSKREAVLQDLFVSGAVLSGTFRGGTISPRGCLPARYLNGSENHKKTALNG